VNWRALRDYFSLAPLPKPGARLEAEKVYALFPVLSRIEYLGKVMQVSHHLDWRDAGLVAEYVDDRGIVHELTLNIEQLKAIARRDGLTESSL